MKQSENKKWQQILLRQQLANVKKWISQLEQAYDLPFFINSEYENILRALESALRIPHAFEYAYKLVVLLHPVLIDSGDWNRWQIYLNQLHDAAKDASNLQMGTIYVQLGDVKGKLGAFKESEQYYQSGIKLFRKIEDYNNLAIALGRLAIVHANKNELAEAKNICDQALEIANAQNDISISSKISLNLSYIYYRLQDFKSSLKHAEIAYQNFRNLKMKRDATKALLNIVALSSELGDWLDVERQAQSLLDDLDKEADITIYSQLKNIMGVAAYNQEKYGSAESAWHESLLLHLQINDNSQIAGIYNNLGMVYTKLNEWEAAQEMLVKAIDTYQWLEDSYNIANARDNLADFYIEQEEFEDACNILQVAIDELTANKESPNSAHLISQMQEKLMTLRAHSH